YVRIGHTSTTHLLSLFSFHTTPTTESSTLSLHDALPISIPRVLDSRCANRGDPRRRNRVAKRQWRTICCSAYAVDICHAIPTTRDRKSTRLNSSHSQISYAVFCLKKKKKKK